MASLDVVAFRFLPSGCGPGLPRGRSAVIVGAVFGAKERMGSVNNLLITFPGRRNGGRRESSASGHHLVCAARGFVR